MAGYVLSNIKKALNLVAFIATGIASSYTINLVVTQQYTLIVQSPVLATVTKE